MRTQARSGEKILVVDDDQAFLRLLAIHLKSLGYDIVTATGGGEALATLKADLPRVVITDLKMQGIDGLGVLDAVVRQHPGLRSTRPNCVLRSPVPWRFPVHQSPMTTGYRKLLLAVQP